MHSTLPQPATATNAPDVQGKRRNDDDKWWLLLLLFTADDLDEAAAFWAATAPQEYAGLLKHDGFTFDQTTQKYLDSDNQPVPDADLKTAYLETLAVAVSGMEANAMKMADGKFPLASWQTSQAQAIKKLYTAGAALGAGGIDRLTNADLANVKEGVGGSGLSDAIARLKKFGEQIEEKEAGSTSQIVNRAGQYASPAHGLYELTKRAAHARATDKFGRVIQWEERNVLGIADHCHTKGDVLGCVEVTEAGWQPLGSLPLTGLRTCGPACRCSMESRVKPEPDSMAMSAAYMVKLADGRSVEVLALSGDESKFSSTQINLPSEHAATVLKMSHKIKDADLADDGRETDPHVTVKYGLHTSDAEDVASALKDESPISMKVGKASLFPATDKRQSDVIKFDVDSPDLHRLNAKLSKLPNTTTFPDYHPHLTVAYVKPGMGQKYLSKMDDLTGAKIKADRVRFSNQKHVVTDIPLGSTALALAANTEDPNRVDARNRYLQAHLNLTAEERDVVNHGHGRYLGSCGHVDSQCRCGDGGTYQMNVPCHKCKSLALAASGGGPILSRCPVCSSFNVQRRPNVVPGRSLDRCRDCGNMWLHKPGSITAAMHTPDSVA